MAGCSTPDCQRSAWARGLCNACYQRLRRRAARTGVPLAAVAGSRLPQTWETKTPKPTLPKREFPEIVLAPDDPEAQRRLRIILRRHDADDLTDMLGLRKEH